MVLVDNNIVIIIIKLLDFVKSESRSIQKESSFFRNSISKVVFKISVIYHPEKKKRRELKKIIHFVFRG